MVEHIPIEYIYKPADGSDVLYKDVSNVNEWTLSWIIHHVEIKLDLLTNKLLFIVV